MKKQTHFYTAMYLRLSRDDNAVKGSKAALNNAAYDKTAAGGISKTESNSISSQRELIRSFLNAQPDMELYDSYVDDGFSGSNFDRPEFRRMIKDIEDGRVNCVVVKDLSRFGRDYIETGRYLEKIFPSLDVRFIALTDHYDSLSADTGERHIVLPVKNFINDSYCRDISTKVKSQLTVKRKAGECLSAFAVYGYRKSPEDKNKLVIDDYAAEIVRKIFEWKIEGCTAFAIAQKLNTLSVLSPKEYKKSIGLRYEGGFSGGSGSLWSSTSVKRILTDEIYLGHLLQGKTERINYKVKKSIEKPKEEWIRAENAHAPVISQDDFLIVQNLLRSDGRMIPEKRTMNPFTGLLFCGDCREQMVRRIIRYKDKSKVYYICSTKNRGEGCSRHSMEENDLKEIVEAVLKKYVNSFLEQERLFKQVREGEINLEAVKGLNREMLRLKQEQDKYLSLCKALDEDLQKGIVTQEELERLRKKFEERAEQLKKAERHQQQLVKEMLDRGAAAAGRIALFREYPKLREVDRHTLASLVKRIWIYEDKRVEMEFFFSDPYLTVQESINTQ